MTIQMETFPTETRCACEVAGRMPALKPLPTHAVNPSAERGVRVDLSSREQEILIAWLKADTKAAVGETLYLADSTVRTYVQRIREKYERAGRPARSKAALLARAIQDGYISVDDL
ncbi:DNA-binding response regulator [Mycobacterium sp. NS-7484]|uniref:LuxR C-terminal-related transcriptional regulator n=1 Tax=Mycobacterium sp. NS-7484 TaxID=1834161 RepID=UPI001E5E52AB|nr:DNA-binding response regulator [Mycobacterium sp. NS-7484]